MSNSGSNPTRFARVRVYFDGEYARRQHEKDLNTFQLYIGEILGHAGVMFDWFERADSIDRSSSDLLIVALADDSAATAERVRQYASQGGGVIALANLQALADGLGCAPTAPLSVGYAMLPGTTAGATPLRFLQAAPWLARNSAVEQIGQLFAGRPGGAPAGPVIARARIGDGIIERWAVDPATTVVALQQGVEPVTRDGEPAPDGSGAIDEGILKADDGFTQDWALDRLNTPTGQPYFAYPYADLWREAFIHRLLRLALDLGLTLPFVDYWPDGVDLVATISHDSDLNIDDSALTTLRVLAEAGIQSTWCIVEPGYAPGIYEQVKAQGHELAFHYNSVVHENYRWDADDFKRQFAWLQQATGLAAVTCNKNHYTRFENWGDLFRWLEEVGIQLDQTRGPSKRGNVGLLFGTCHPFFPIAWHDEGNRLYDVLELGFLTQDMDLGSWADSSAIVPFIEQAQRVRGVAHFLFHPVHLHNQEAVRAAFRKVIAQARARGFTFWTSREINEWERARRRVRIMDFDGDGHVSVAYSGDAPAGRLVVWSPVAEPAQPADGQTYEKRFGIWCCKHTVASSLSGDAGGAEQHLHEQSLPSDEAAREV